MADAAKLLKEPRPGMTAVAAAVVTMTMMKETMTRKKGTTRRRRGRRKTKKLTTERWETTSGKAVSHLIRTKKWRVSLNRSRAKCRITSRAKPRK